MYRNMSLWVIWCQQYPYSRERIWKVSKMFLFSQYLIWSNNLPLPGNSSCNEGTLKPCTLWRWDSIWDWILGCRQSFWLGVLTLIALLEWGANGHGEDELACHTVVLWASLSKTNLLKKYAMWDSYAFQHANHTRITSKTCRRWGRVSFAQFGAFFCCHCCWFVCLFSFREEFLRHFPIEPVLGLQRGSAGFLVS